MTELERRRVTGWIWAESLLKNMVLLLHVAIVFHFTGQYANYRPVLVPSCRKNHPYLASSASSFHSDFHNFLKVTRKWGKKSKLKQEIILLYYYTTILLYYYTTSKWGSLHKQHFWLWLWASTLMRLGAQQYHSLHFEVRFSMQSCLHLFWLL